jgi:glycosyltransferase involved in cell wall biosynthesis
MTTISVCLIVRNEEDNIRRALAGVPKSFEIVVGDTGSTDRTIELAASLRAKVYNIDWTDDFAEARNKTAAKATGAYILFLDADEELHAGAEAILRNFVRKHPNRAGAVTIRNRIGEEIHVSQMARFYPNNGEYCYAGTVHETICQGDAAVVCVPTGVTITHYGYENDVYESKGKAKRYFRLYEQHLEQHPNDGYMQYQLGRLQFSLKQYPEAIATLQRCLLLGQEQHYFPVMIVMLGYALKYTGQSAHAESMLTPYVTEFPRFPDLPFLLGLLAMDTGKLNDIERYFRMALTIGDTDIYTSVYGVGTFKAAYNLGVFYEITGQLDTAKRYYREAVKYDYAPAKERLKILKKHI